MYSETQFYIWNEERHSPDDPSDIFPPSNRMDCDDPLEHSSVTTDYILSWNTTLALSFPSTSQEPLARFPSVHSEFSEGEGSDEARTPFEDDDSSLSLERVLMELSSFGKTQADIFAKISLPRGLEGSAAFNSITSYSYPTGVLRAPPGQPGVEGFRCTSELGQVEGKAVMKFKVCSKTKCGKSVSAVVEVVSRGSKFEAETGEAIDRLCRALKAVDIKSTSQDRLPWHSGSFWEARSKSCNVVNRRALKMGRREGLGVQRRRGKRFGYEQPKDWKAYSKVVDTLSSMFQIPENTEVHGSPRQSAAANGNLTAVPETGRREGMWQRRRFQEASCDEMIPDDL